jgi:hypothetical protein
MTDPDQPGEDFDEELLEGGGDYPPDRPLGVDDDDEVESVAEREARTEPDVWEERRPSDEDDEDDEEPEVELVGDDAGVPDEEDELVGEGVPTGSELGPLDPDDEFSGDETTRDVATELVPPPAEETAIHLDDEP